MNHPFMHVFPSPKLIPSLLLNTPSHPYTFLFLHSAYIKQRNTMDMCTLLFFLFLLWTWYTGMAFTFHCFSFFLHLWIKTKPFTINNIIQFSSQSNDNFQFSTYCLWCCLHTEHNHINKPTEFEVIYTYIRLYFFYPVFLFIKLDISGKPVYLPFDWCLIC